MKKANHNSEYMSGDKFSTDLRAQPRKSNFQRHKAASARGHFSEDGEHHHTHRNEPAKNAIRVQLRRIQQLF